MSSCRSRIYPSNFYYEPSKCHDTPGLCFDGLEEEYLYTFSPTGLPTFRKIFRRAIGVSLHSGTPFPRDHTGVSLYSPLTRVNKRVPLHPRTKPGVDGKRIHSTTQFFHPLLQDESMNEGTRPLLLLQRLQLPTHPFRAPSQPRPHRLAPQYLLHRHPRSTLL